MATKKKLWLAGAALAGVLLVFSGSRSPGFSARLIDSNGQPLAGAYVLAFRLTPALGRWVHHKPYQSERDLARADAAGRVVLPGRIRFHFPLLQFFHPPKLQVAIFVPSLHNFCRIEDVATWQPDPPCGPEQMTLAARSPEPVLKFQDQSAQPEYWYASVFQLVYTLLADPGAPGPEPRELTAATRSDLEQFAGKYGGTIREIKSDGFIWISQEDRTQFQGQQRPWAFYLGREWLGKTLPERISEIENGLK